MNAVDIYLEHLYDIDTVELMIVIIIELNELQIEEIVLVYNCLEYDSHGLSYCNTSIFVIHDRRQYHSVS